MNLVGCNNQVKNIDQSNKFDIYGKTWIKISVTFKNEWTSEGLLANDIVITKDSMFTNSYVDREIFEGMTFREEIVKKNADTLFFYDGEDSFNLIFNPVTPDSIIVKFNINNSNDKRDNWSEIWIAFPFEERFFNGLLPTSDEALLELTKWKGKKDLELITQQKYNLKLEQLKPYIK
tara:strand:- start:511 stop:1041 length:531 start_codon:yes stop_codon:yes gene_type:complete